MNESVLVRTLLDATLVFSQVLLLNWLGLPFAAITLFSGVAAYSVAVTLSIGTTGILFCFPLVLLLTLGFVALVQPLPEDHFLLLTLASLEVMRSVAGSIPALGGQLGIDAYWASLEAQRPEQFLPYAVALFGISLGIIVLLHYSQMGLAVHVARLSSTEVELRSMVPKAALTNLLFGIAVALACCAGSLQALYSGRVDPNVFRIDNAIVVLVATLASGRHPLRAALVASAFFIFPDLFSEMVGYQLTVAANIREIIWGLVIFLFVRKHWSGLGDSYYLAAR